MSEEVVSAFVERRAFDAALTETEQHRAAEQALQSQLAASHEQIAILETARAQAQADSVALRTAVAAYLSATTFTERGRRFRQLRDLLRTEHPGAALLAQLAELTKANSEVADLNVAYLIALDAAAHALLSYAHGNSAPDLALEVAEFIQETLEGRGRAIENGRKVRAE